MGKQLMRRAGWWHREWTQAAGGNVKRGDVAPVQQWAHLGCTYRPSFHMDDGYLGRLQKRYISYLIAGEK